VLKKDGVVVSLTFRMLYPLWRSHLYPLYCRWAPEPTWVYRKTRSFLTNDGNLPRTIYERDFWY